MTDLKDFDRKYMMYSRPADFDFLGTPTHGLIKLNCIMTDGQPTTRQIEAYQAYLGHISQLNNSLYVALAAYKCLNHIPADAAARVTSVQFNSECSFLLLDTSWDEEEGVAAVFDLEGNVTRIVPQDQVL